MGKRFKRILPVLLCLLLLGCAEETVPPQTTAATVQVTTEAPAAATAEPSTEPVTVDAEAEAEVMEEAPLPVAVVPEAEATGAWEERCDAAVIDYSNTGDGYVMVRYLVPSESRLKVLVKGPTTTYSYNLPVDIWTVFPLSDGNGTYQIGVYQNTYESKYAKVIATTFDVTMADEFAPFLRPNQYVDYSQATKAVATGLQITAGLEAPLEKVAAVYDYVVTNFTYDKEKAATVESGYLPVLDQVLEEKTGICFDYAALMTAMLRSQEIPCKLVVGYAGEVYHAWISVWTEENGWIDGVIFFDGHTWKRMDPTFASSGAGDASIMDYIENGSYTAKYLY